MPKKKAKKAPQKQRKGKSPKPRSRRPLVGAAVGGTIVLALVLAVFIARSVGGGGVEVEADIDPVKGSAEAAVVVQEFSDFQCPSCKAATPIAGQLLERFPGQVKFEYENYPLSGHQWAYDAALAGECALEQDKFWEYHDDVFAAQEEWSTSANGRTEFRRIASKVGLDMEAYDECLTSSETRAKVDNDLAEGRSKNVNSTPTFFVNDRRFVGSSFDEFIKLVEAELNQG